MVIFVQRKLVILFQNPDYSFWFFLAIFLIFRNLSFFVLFFLAIYSLRTQADPNCCQLKENYDVFHRKLFDGALIIGVIISVFIYVFIQLFLPSGFLEIVLRSFAWSSMIPDKLDLCILSDFASQPDSLKSKWLKNRDAILTSYAVMVLSYVYICFLMSLFFLDLHCVLKEIKLKGRKWALFFIIFVVALGVIFLLITYLPNKSDCSIYYGAKGRYWLGLIFLPYCMMVFWMFGLILYKYRVLFYRKFFG